VAEKVASLRTMDYLRERAKRGSRKKLLAGCDRQAVDQKALVNRLAEKVLCLRNFLLGHFDP
jgi:hypothetical protein